LLEAKMSESMAHSRIAAVLRDRFGDLVTRCCQLYETSILRMPSPIDRRVVARLVEPIFESFTDALPADDNAVAPLALRAGSAEIRELEKSVGFVGSLMAASGARGYDVAALLVAVRDTLRESFGDDATPELARLFEWLGIVALDSFGNAKAEREKELQREQLERGTPIVWLTRDLPAVFLVGAPDALVVDAVLARLLLAVVRCDARVLIADVTGLEDATAEEVLVPTARFLQHRKLADTEILVVGADGEARPSWNELARLGPPIQFHADFTSAFQRGLAVTGMRLVKSPGS
jgi:hypothetical protein